MVSTFQFNSAEILRLQVASTTLSGHPGITMAVAVTRTTMIKCADRGNKQK